MKIMDGIRLYTAEEAIQITGLSRHLLRQLAVRGVIGTVDCGKSKLYQEAELEKIKRGEVELRKPRKAGPYYLDPACTIPLPDGAQWHDRHDLMALGYKCKGISKLLRDKHERQTGQVVFDTKGHRVGLMKEVQ